MGDRLELEIKKDFSFEAAHYFEHEHDGHPFRRVHGHSFCGSVTLKGEAREKEGWVKDFWKLDTIIKDVVDRLDHSLLNDIKGLEQPSLEQIALWLFQKFSPRLDGLERVEVRRPSCGESATIQRKPL